MAKKVTMKDFYLDEEMTQINRDFMKGRIVHNDNVRDGDGFGIVENFCATTENNQYHPDKVVFTVRKLRSRERATWWYYSEKNGLNRNIHIIGEEDSKLIRRY